MTSFTDYIDVARIIAPSLITAAALAISASIVGVFVLLRREALVALAMPQVVAIGAAVGLRLGWPSLPPALAAIVIAALLLVWSRRESANHWLLPALYVAGLSISFLIIANSGQPLAELQAIFTGIDVSVTTEQAMLATPILLVAGAVCAILWRRWLLISQASATAEAAGLKPQRWEIIFLALLTIVLLLGTNAIGTLMVIAMLFLPAATVLPWTRRIPATLIAAAVLALLFLLAGFVLSVEMQWPMSQSVGGVGFAALIIANLAARIVR
jgi:ABC-type Mn2+/Zn2+ transport system permease subunit